MRPPKFIQWDSPKKKFIQWDQLVHVSSPFKLLPDNARHAERQPFCRPLTYCHMYMSNLVSFHFKLDPQVISTWHFLGLQVWKLKLVHLSSSLSRLALLA